MRKFVLIILPYLFFSTSIFSQDSLFSKNKYPGSPLIVIRGKDIRRFPSTNFLDAVNGLFPWIFSETPDANNFLFVVNGYVLQDINALTLYDIDEVVFTRNNLNGSLYPFSRAGTFYIKTKTSVGRKPEINFNSQYNILWNKDGQALPVINYQTYPQENLTNNKTGGLFSNQVSVAAGGEKLHVYGSLQLDAMQEPHLYHQRIITSPITGTDSTEGDLKTRQTNFRSFLNAEYHFSDKLSAGVTGSYFYGESHENYLENGTTIIGGVYHEAEVRALPLQYYHAGSFINWNPVAHLSNKFSFEYADDHLNDKETGQSKIYQADTLANEINSVTKGKSYNKSYLFRDEANYDIISNQKFKAGVSAIFSYVHYNMHTETMSTASQGGLPTFSGNFSTSKGRITAIHPGIHFSYTDIFSAYAGYNFFLNKGSSNYTKDSRANPYAGLTIDLKNALKIKSANRLDLSVDYGDLPENGFSNYLLPHSDPQYFFTVFPLYGSGQVIFIPNPSLQNTLLKNKLWGVQANSGLFRNKLLLGAEWTFLQAQRLFIIPVPVGGNQQGYMAVIGNEKQTGFSVFMAAKLLENKNTHWVTRLNVLLPHVTYDINGTPPPLDNPVNYKLQTGLQNKFQFRNFTMQVNLLYAYDRRFSVIDIFGGTEQKGFNEFSLNYVMFGYDLSHSKNSFLRNLGVFIQGRNLLSSKKARQYYQFDSYGGAGINLKFN